MASVPDSLIFEFLTRLSVKYLARFKCVNRFWRSIISHPDFIYAQLERAKALYSDSCLIISCLLHDDNMSNSSTVHFYNIKNHEPAVLEYPAQVIFDSYHCLPSCNGLVCFYGAHAGIYACNPSTKSIVRIPDSNFSSGSRLLSCGFGFDQRTRSYKIIKILEPFRPEKIRNANDHDGLLIEAFTIGSKSWRAMKIDNSFGFLNRQSPVYSKGLFSWLSIHDSSGFFIQSFNVGSESFGVIHVPEEVSGEDCRLFSLEELGGQLCLVDLDFELEGKKRMDLWLLKGVVSDDCEASLGPGNHSSPIRIARCHSSGGVPWQGDSALIHRRVRPLGLV